MRSSSSRLVNKSENKSKQEKQPTLQRPALKNVQNKTAYTNEARVKYWNNLRRSNLQQKGTLDRKNGIFDVKEEFDAVYITGSWVPEHSGGLRSCNNPQVSLFVPNKLLTLSVVLKTSNKSLNEMGICVFICQNYSGFRMLEFKEWSVVARSEYSVTDIVTLQHTLPHTEKEDGGYLIIPMLQFPRETADFVLTLRALQTDESSSHPPFLFDWIPYNNCFSIMGKFPSDIPQTRKEVSLMNPQIELILSRPTPIRISLRLLPEVFQRKKELVFGFLCVSLKDCKTKKFCKQKRKQISKEEIVFEKICVVTEDENIVTCTADLPVKFFHYIIVLVGKLSDSPFEFSLESDDDKMKAILIPETKPKRIEKSFSDVLNSVPSVSFDAFSAKCFLENPLELLGPFLEKENVFFYDADFPPNEKSLNSNSSDPNVLACEGWLRCVDLVDSPTLCSPIQLGSDFQQGAVGDCWLISTISAITMVYPELLNQLFVSTKFASYGIYCARLFYQTQPFYFVIDDYLPHNNNEFFGSRCKDVNILIISLLEKVFAKLFGSYQNLDGITGKSIGFLEAFSLLCGTKSFYFTIPLKGEMDFALWRKLSLFEKKKFFITCGTRNATTFPGVIKSHGYVIAQLHQFEGLSFFKICGDFEVKSEENSRLKVYAAKNNKITESFTNSKLNSLLMSFYEFSLNFSTIYLCINPSILFRFRKVAKTEWNEINTRFSHTVPQLALIFRDSKKTEKTTNLQPVFDSELVCCVFTISRTSNCTKDNRCSILIFQTEQPHQRFLQLSNQPFFSQSYSCESTIQINCVLYKNEAYTIVCQLEHQAFVTEEFTVSIESEIGFSIVKVPQLLFSHTIAGKWNSYLSGGYNDFMNPRFLLIVRKTSDLFVCVTREGEANDGFGFFIVPFSNYTSTVPPPESMTFRSTLQKSDHLEILLENFKTGKYVLVVDRRLEGCHQKIEVSIASYNRISPTKTEKIANKAMKDKSSLPFVSLSALKKAFIEFEVSDEDSDENKEKSKINECV